MQSKPFRAAIFFSTVIAIGAGASAFGQSADGSVSKSAPATAAAGSDVPFTVSVTNFGPDDGSPFTLTDPLPAGMTFVSATQNNGPTFLCNTPPVDSGGTITCTIATLPAGSTASFTFVAKIPAPTGAGVEFTNVASVSTPTDPNEENNNASATTSTPPAPQADMAISKVGSSLAGPDTDVVYTITLANAGPDAATTVALSDPLPGTLTFVSLSQTGSPTMSCTTPAVGSGGTITCTAATFAAGGSVTLTLTAHVPPATPSGTTFLNTVAVSSDDDPNAENNSASTSTTVSAVDVSVTKTGPATAPAGNLTYTLVVANAGPDPASNVRLLDTLPAGATFVSFAQNNGPTAQCVLPAVGGGGAVSCTFTVPFVAAASAQFTLVVAAASSVTNTASVASDSFDSNASNDTSSVTTTVTGVADLVVTKSAPATATAGSTLTYTVSVANNGPSAAGTVALTDVLPPTTTLVSVTQTGGPAFNCTSPAAGTNGTVNCTIGFLPAASTGSFSIVVNTTAPASLVNTASATTATSDPNSANNSATAPTVVSAGSTDLSIVKTAGSGPYVIGQPLTYTIVATNNGPAIAFGTVVTDVLPAGTTFVSAVSTQGTCTGGPTVTCNVGTLPSAASATITLIVTLPSTAGPVANTATLAATNVDLNPVNNSSATTVNVVISAPAVPALSPFALAVLAGILAIAGAVALRQS